MFKAASSKRSAILLQVNQPRDASSGFAGQPIVAQPKGYDQ